MLNSTDKDTIEGLKASLSLLEIHADLLRRKLRTLVQGVEQRRCIVEISWDDSEQVYVTKFLKHGQLVYFEKTNKYRRARAAIGIESVHGKHPRVSWKQIDSGIPWVADAVISELFWQRNCERADVTPPKIFHLDMYRHLKRDHSSLNH